MIIKKNVMAVISHRSNTQWSVYKKVRLVSVLFLIFFYVGVHPVCTITIFVYVLRIIIYKKIIKNQYCW